MFVAFRHIFMSTLRLFGPWYCCWELKPESPDTLVNWLIFQFSSVQSLSHVQLCNPMNRSTPGLPVHHHLLDSTQTHVHCPSDAIQPSQPPSSPSLPAFNLYKHQGLFKWVSSLHEVAKILKFQLQYQSSNEHPGLISFRMDWLDLLAVQRTLKSLLQHHSSKASILQRSAFFMAQLSHPYRTTGKTIALTIWNFVGNATPLLWICYLGWS